MARRCDVNAEELLARLRRHYLKPGPMPGGVFVPECGINGRQGSSRRCDALYVGFTSASGRRLIGHELKVSRSDWRHELDQPAKADSWADECHEWYVVAPSTDIVPPDELPAGWGLLVPNTRTKIRMDIAVKATRKPDDHNPSWDIVRSVMARVDTLHQGDVSAIKREHAETIRQEVDAAVEKMRQHIGVPDELRHAKQLVDHLNGLLRIDLSAWASGDDNRCTPEEFAAALNVVRHANAVARPYNGAESTAARLEELAGQVRTLAKATRDLAPHSDPF